MPCHSRVLGYILGPEGHWNVWGGSYEEGTLIHVGRWTTGDTVIECREALAMPATPDRLVLLRRIRAVRGDARVTLRLEDGTWSTHGGGLHLHLTGAAGATLGRQGLLATDFTVASGETHDLVLEIGTRAGTEKLDPGRLRPAGAVRRGVRRSLAPAPRQPAAGVRPRPTPRGGGTPQRRPGELNHSTSDHGGGVNPAVPDGGSCPAGIPGSWP
ncbi:hypothetical protein [Streptomyces sp. NPDC021212]|uniref:hypothetical protein n=1 Tax=Streptomyces sp. NPDC021212 TaxID=3365118 RepID=UPI003795361B